MYSETAMEPEHGLKGHEHDLCPSCHCCSGYCVSYTCAIVLAVLFVLFTLYEETKYIPISIGSTENVSINQDSLEMLDQSSRPDAQSAADPEYNSSSNDTNSYRQRMCFLTRTEEPTPLKIGMFPRILDTGIQCANCVLFLILLSTINSITFSRPPYNFNTARVCLMLLGPPPYRQSHVVLDNQKLISSL